MNENKDKVEALKKQLASFLKQKDDLFADYMRVDGIIAYITNELNTLDSDWKKIDQNKDLNQEVKSIKK